MLRLLFLVSASLTLLTIIGCSKTVYEPAEPEHGGLFLNGTPTHDAANPNP